MSAVVNQVKHFRTSKELRFLKSSALFICIAISAGVVGAVFYLFWFDNYYQNRIFPNVYVGSVPVGGTTPQQIMSYWDKRNESYKAAQFEFRLASQVATISGETLNLGYDSRLIAKQAFLIGRSGNFLSDMYTKLIKEKSAVTPYFRWDEDTLALFLDQFSQTIDTPPKNARFTFENGKVTEFHTAEPGKRVQRALAEEQFTSLFPDIPYSTTKIFPINLTVEVLEPSIKTADSNSFGIKEKIATGYSEFAGSIPGRIHNVALAASKFNGVLIPPDAVFSFNTIIGDISAATGYQAAYIIKEGRTVLGDGGGVCQVSTTMFRAALNAGLPIVDWTPHAYRVKYYEQADYKPGLDATVYVPSVDFKFKNDTGHHILIQTITDKKNTTLTINFYGTHDGRKAEILNHNILSQSPPPAPLYQDDPSLAPGVVRQVDWSAWGAKTVFTYHVTRGNETLINRVFQANFRPWQAVFLRGPVN